MTFHVILWHYLEVAPHLLLIWVVALLCKKGLHRRYPIFCAYLVSEILQFAVLYPMIVLPQVSGYAYFVAYSVGTGISVALRFGIIHEISAEVFRNYPVLSRFGKPAFRWGTVFFLWAALLLTLALGAHEASHVLSTVLILRRIANILQCGLLVLLFLFASYFGLSWRHYTFAIAFGLGVFASIDLVETAIRSQLGSEGTTVFDYFIMAVYHCCVLVWLIYLWLPERSPQLAVKTVPDHDLDNWNKELQRLIQQ
jgi:hypothetical protein